MNKYAAFQATIHCVRDLTCRQQPEMCHFEPLPLDIIYPKV